MTGNFKLIKIINRLGHGVSYTKLADVDTAYAIQNISTNSGLMPEEIQPYQQASIVYGNFDSLGETLSGAGTTHSVNGIVIQKAFIGPKLPQNLIDIPKTKQRIIYVEPPPVLRDTSITKYERQFGSYYSRNVKQEKPYMVSVSIFQQRKTKYQ